MTMKQYVGNLFEKWIRKKYGWDIPKVGSEVIVPAQEKYGVEFEKWFHSIRGNAPWAEHIKHLDGLRPFSSAHSAASPVGAVSSFDAESLVVELYLPPVGQVDRGRDCREPRR